MASLPQPNSVTCSFSRAEGTVEPFRRVRQRVKRQDADAATEQTPTPLPDAPTCFRDRGGLKIGIHNGTGSLEIAGEPQTHASPPITSARDRYHAAGYVR
jgi:hypothetical protein